MADVVRFPKRYTSYRVAFLPFKDAPKLSFTMQVPFDKLDDFLEYLFAMKQEEVYWYEVHGHLADGTTDVIRGDIKAAEPRGRISINHKALISPGTTNAEMIRKSAEGYINEQRNKVAAGVTRRRDSLTVATPVPASTPVEMLDTNGKVRYRWDAHRAQYVEVQTGHTISTSQWAEIKAARERKRTPPATIVKEKLEEIANTPPADPLAAFPVVLTSIKIEEMK